MIILLPLGCRVALKEVIGAARTAIKGHADTLGTDPEYLQICFQV